MWRVLNVNSLCLPCLSTFLLHIFLEGILLSQSKTTLILGNLHMQLFRAVCLIQGPLYYSFDPKSVQCVVYLAACFLCLGFPIWIFLCEGLCKQQGQGEEWGKGWSNGITFVLSLCCLLRKNLSFTACRDFVMRNPQITGCCQFCLSPWICHLFASKYRR